MIPIYFQIVNHDCCLTVIKMWGLTLWRNLLSMIFFFFFFPSRSVDVVWSVLPPGIACLPEGSKTQQEMQHQSTTCCMRQEDEQIHTLTWENIKWQTWVQYRVFKYRRNWINKNIHDYAFFPVFLWQSYGKLVSICMKVQLFDPVMIQDHDLFLPLTKVNTIFYILWVFHVLKIHFPYR